jgi:hypothetical protein
MAILPKGGFNPFDGIHPDVTVLGVEFNSLWKVLLAVVWGIAIVLLAFKAIPAWLSVTHARHDGRVHDYAEAMAQVKTWGLSLVGVVTIPLMFVVVNLLFF